MRRLLRSNRGFGISVTGVLCCGFVLWVGFDERLILDGHVNEHNRFACDEWVRKLRACGQDSFAWKWKGNKNPDMQLLPINEQLSQSK